VKTPVKVIDVVHPLDRGEPLQENALNLLPPAPGLCQVCAVDHPEEQPHNNGSLYYQMRFHAEHGRWPTWQDALAHCNPVVQALWERELRERGVWTEVDPCP
jgi:predicted RNA-binding protein with PUA-like domain